MLVSDGDGEADFEVTLIDSTPLLVFRPQGVAQARWADFHALDLEGATLDGLLERPRPESPREARLQNRWLNLKDALLITNEEPLARLLAGLRFDAAGIDGLRLVPSFEGFHILGRATANGRQAPFSIRLELRPAVRNPRHLKIDFSEVRLFGFVDRPAPQIAISLAAGLAAEIAAVTPAFVRASGAILEVDVLEVALAQFLVTRGWRLPHVRSTHLMALDWGANRLQLHFSSTLGARSGRIYTGAGAEAAAVDLTEEACRQRYLNAPTDRRAQLQWLAFRVAAHGADAAKIAADAITSDPTEVAPYLWAAVAAAEAGAAAEAAAHFLQAARVAEAAGEMHDVALARQAAALANPAASPLPGSAFEAQTPPDSPAPPPAEGAAEEPPVVTVPAAPPERTPAPELARQEALSEALRLTSALHSLPATAFEESLEVKEQLAAIHIERADWATADEYVKSVLRRDPTRISMVEKQITVDEHLGRHEDAARGYAHLARLHRSPGERARALFAEGEIRRERLGDPAGALAAYLKSSDLDATFVPTARQLLAWFWRSSAFEEVASIGDDLAREPAAWQHLDPQERVRLAAATVLASSDGATTNTAPSATVEAPDELRLVPYDPEVAASALIEVAVARVSAATDDVPRVAARLLGWERSADGAGAVPDLASTLESRLHRDLAEPGVARALGTILDLENDRTGARICYTFAVFLEPADGAAARLVEMLDQRDPDTADHEEEEEEVALEARREDPLTTLEGALAEAAIPRDPSGAATEAPLDGARRASSLRTPRMGALFRALFSSRSRAPTRTAAPPASP